jgi:GH25 family lysozyme M1 (1,4-beta-N-acetylmuramidase)
MYTFGIDLSFWQSNRGYAPQQFFNPFLAKERGVQFAFIKASERIGKDPSVEVFQQSFKEAGIPRGFYHFARYSQLSGVDARSQARFFWNVIKEYDSELPPVLDLEDRTLVNGNGIGMSWIQAFLYTLRDLCGRNPIIYTSDGYYSSIGKSNEAVSKWITDFPLWIANYLSNSQQLPQYNRYEDSADFVASQITATKPLIPSIFKDKGWRFWQYSQIGDAYYYGGKYDFPTRSGLDMNIYNGSVEDLYAEFDIYGEAPEPPPVIDPPVEPPIVIPTRIRTKPDMPSTHLRFRHRPEMYEGDTLAVGPGVVMELVEPNTVSGRDNAGNLLFFWHVRLDGYEGYVSAGSKYTELWCNGSAIL